MHLLRQQVCYQHKEWKPVGGGAEVRFEIRPFMICMVANDGQSFKTIFKHDACAVTKKQKAVMKQDVVLYC